MAQEVRALWRGLALLVKAKLAAVEAGISEFEVEFLPHTILPDGSTVAEQVLPTIEAAYRRGAVAPLLAPPPA